MGFLSRLKKMFWFSGAKKDQVNPVVYANPRVEIKPTIKEIPFKIDYHEIEREARRNVGHSEIVRACKKGLKSIPFVIVVNRIENGRTYVYVQVAGGKRIPKEGYFQYPGTPPQQD